MCAIIDANVVAEVFGTDRSAAGAGFHEWLDAGRGVLVAGGKLRAEMLQSTRFQEWAKSALLAGRLRYEEDQTVNERMHRIEEAGACLSDDPHVLALAQVSGARLLYTNDRNLQRDFKNGALIDGPRGKIYSTPRSRQFTKAHRRLLADRKLCRSGPGP